MNPFGGVGGRLALALLLIVTGALAIVYLIVVPSYRTSLIDTRLSTLETSMRTLLQDPWESDYLIQQWAEDSAPKANARVVVFTTLDSDQSVYPLADSNTLTSADVTADPIVARAAKRLTIARGTVSRDGRQFAEVA